MKSVQLFRPAGGEKYGGDSRDGDSSQSIKSNLFELRNMRINSLQRQGRDKEASILKSYNIPSSSSNTNNIPSSSSNTNNTTTKQSIKSNLFELRNMRINSLQRQGRDKEASILKSYNIPSSSSNTNNIPSSSSNTNNTTTKQSIKSNLFELRNMRINSLQRQGRDKEASILKSYNIPSSSSNNIIKENTGAFNPDSSPDRRILPIFDPNFKGYGALQPGEVVITKEATNYWGGVNAINQLNAVDKNSNISKDGKSNAILSKPNLKKPNISPPSNSRGRIAPITLPPITQSAGSAPTSSAGGTQVPPFSASCPSAMFVRINNADTYGIVG
jgi:hypothetical protein